jgi:hypothetical protein
MSNPCYSFKRLFILYFYAMIPFCLFTGILSLLEEMPIYLNEKPITGWKGLAIAVLYIPLAALVLTVANWLTLKIGLLVAALGGMVFKKETS